MNIQELEQQHQNVQLVCNEALAITAFAVQLACHLGKQLKEWVATLPDSSHQESEADRLFSPELHAWLDEYLKLSDLELAEPISQTKPRVMQQAMKLLEIIPPIVTQKEK